jgi:hypothetical protein
MSGALHRLHEAGLHQKNGGPNIVTMAGAGAVVGLHYLAPNGVKSKTRFCPEALQNTINFGVSDALFEMFPVNYKVFTKAGPSADRFNEVWYSFSEVKEALYQSGMSDDEALMADTLLFAGAMMCPSDVDYLSQGVCGHAQFIEELVDFDALQDIDPNDIEIEINAFSIEDQEIVDFTNYERHPDKTPVLDARGRYRRKAITPDHLRAALAFPFLRAPYKIGDRHYFEGAAIQSLNDYEVKDAKEIEWFLVLDPLQRSMIGMPQNLWDAYALSIIMPTAGLTELGRFILEFRRMVPRLMRAQPQLATIADALGGLPENQRLSTLETMLLIEATRTSALYFSDFTIPKDKVRGTWGWSRSSMKDLFEIGRRSGADLVLEMQKNGHL